MGLEPKFGMNFPKIWSFDSGESWLPSVGAPAEAESGLRLLVGGTSAFATLERFGVDQWFEANVASLHPLLFFLVTDQPLDDVIVGHFDAWMPGVVFHIGVVDLEPRGRGPEIGHRLVSVDVGKRHHVDYVHQAVVPVIAQKRPHR